MDPRFREDDAGKQSFPRHCRHFCASAVIPAPLPSFLRRQESIPMSLENSGACDQGDCAGEAEEGQHGGQQDDAGDAAVVGAKAFG